MLTDIFEVRYSAARIWDDYNEATRRLLLQAYKILSEDLLPSYDGKGAKIDANERIWRDLDSRLSRELGLEHLSTPSLSHFNYTAEQVCRNFMLAERNDLDPDVYVKRRLSLIELAFRMKGEGLPTKRTVTRTRTKVKAEIADFGLSLEKLMISMEQGQHDRFRDAVNELNQRFKAASASLHYHSGFIQRTTDQLVAREVEEPFWATLSDERWVNVVTDMKEAIDRRDGDGRDPALYAAKALESTIKIAAAASGATTGRETGAGAFIESLASVDFINAWEAQSLRAFFKSVRNPLGHGPGDQPMPRLDALQTSWAIEFAMIWVKLLATRLATVPA